MLIIIVFGAVSFINAVIDMFEPQGTYGAVSPGRPIGAELALREELRELYPNLSDEEIADLARDEHEAQLGRQKAAHNYRRWRRLVQTAVLMVIAFPIYRYHWRGAKALSD